MFTRRFPHQFIASAIAVQFLLTSGAFAQSGMFESQPNDDRLRESITRKDLVDPLVTTRSLIDLPRGVNEAEYWIRSKNGEPFNMLEDNRQQIIRREGNNILLKVRKYVPNDPIRELPLEADKNFTESGRYIDHANPKIYEKAHELTDDQLYAYSMAKVLQKWIYDNIQTRKNYEAPQPASETLRTRKGNAVEKALLLAAMGRSVGIPTRIATGMQFAELGETGIGSFRYHTWTEIFVGEWVGLDADQEDFRMDATHIKLADTPYSALSAPNVLLDYVGDQMSRMEIEVLRAEAAGSTEVSLTGRTEDNALQIPKIDIMQIDIQNQTKQATQTFALVPRDNILNIRVPESLFTYGVEKLLDSDIDGARKAFSQLSGNLLTDPMQHYSLGEKLTGLGMYQLAQKEFELAGSGDPALKPSINSWYREQFPAKKVPTYTEDAYLTALGLISRGGDFYAAEDLLLGVIKKEPQFSPAYLQLGQLYFSEGYLDKAQDAYQQFKQIHPNDPRGYQGEGLTLMDLRQYDKALQAFAQARQKASLYHSPQSRRLSHEIDNWFLMAKGRQAIAQNPKSVAGWLHVGDALYEQGRFSDALKAYNNAVIFEPENTQAKLSLLKLYLAQGEKSKTGYLFEALASQPVTGDNAALYYRLRGYKQMRGRFYKDAERDLRKAIQIRPNSADAYMTLADVFDRQRDRENVVAVLRQGVRNVPDLSDKNKLRQRLARKLLYIQPAESRQILNDLVVDDPANPATYHLLGKLALNEGDYGQAQTRFFQSFVLNPDDPENLTDLASLYHEKNYLEEAITYYQRALRIDPGNYQAATLLTELIEENDFRVKKPLRGKRLNTDEYDYLVEYLTTSYQFSLKLRDVYNELADLLGHYDTVGITGIEERQKSVPLLEEHYDINEEQLKRVQSIKPPGRFNEFHYHVAEYYLNNLETAALLLQIIPVYLTEHRAKELQTQLGDQNKEMLESMNKANTSLGEVVDGTDLLQIESILLESGVAPDWQNAAQNLNVHIKAMTRLIEVVNRGANTDTKSKKRRPRNRRPTPKKKKTVKVGDKEIDKKKIDDALERGKKKGQQNF